MCRRSGGTSLCCCSCRRARRELSTCLSQRVRESRLQIIDICVTYRSIKKVFVAVGVVWALSLARSENKQVGSKNKKNYVAPVNMHTIFASLTRLRFGQFCAALAPGRSIFGVQMCANDHHENLISPPPPLSLDVVFGTSDRPHGFASGNRTTVSIANKFYICEPVMTLRCFCLPQEQILVAS